MQLLDSSCDLELNFCMQTLLQTVKDWPREIYDIAAVIVAVRAELDKATSTSATISSSENSTMLMECLAEL